MNNAVLNIKTNAEVKAQAQQVAEELGFSLSSVVNAYLRQLVRTKRVDFTIHEEPSPYFLDQLAQAQEDLKNKRLSPKFSNAKQAAEWLKSSRG